MSYFGNNKQFNITSKGDSCFIRYSAHADGTDFTETWSEGQTYIGLATAQVAPTDKSGYVWCRAVGGKSAYDIACELENFEGTEQEWLNSLKGADGRGIKSILKISTNGLVDTYRIAYTDGATMIFDITNGKDGDNGKTPYIQDGYWYIDGVNTNMKAEGTDGKNGENGKDGKDGLTPYIGDNGTWWIGETDTGVKAEGKDGVSATHSWNGTTLTITSASGTSSADLKGDKGDTYTLTEADKTEIAEQAVELIDDMPDYVVTEAEAVIDRVIAAQGNRTFTFAAISDMHYGNDSYTDGIKHACKALKYIDERIKLDAVAVLGDYTDGYPASAYANAISDFKDINKILDTLRFGQNLRIQGNHDYYEAHKGEINRFIASYSEGVSWGDITGGYFYKDFDGYKIRVICINTTEEGGDISVSTKQYNWFAKSLDLSSKDDASEWQILILSHHPLDWWSNSYVFAYILDAYKKGTTWSNDTISVDFTDKNVATLIGNIHGHIHNFLTDYIHFGNVNGGNKSDILRMATPNACYGRENQYTESVVGVSTWVEDTTYSKTQNTANDTAFCVYVVNLEACTITAICYGAGYDRENVGYLSKAPIVNIIDTVGYTDTKRLGTSDGGLRDNDNTFVTGFIQPVVGDVYRTAGVDFNADNNSNCGVWVYQNDQTYWTYLNTNYSKTPASNSVISIDIDSNGNLTITITKSETDWNDKCIRLCGIGSGANLIVTKNQLIE